MDFYKGIPKQEMPAIDQVIAGVLDVCNPYNRNVIQTLRKQDKNAVQHAIECAARYKYNLTAWQRYEILTEFAARLLQSKEEFSRLISMESGKALKDARVEVTRAHQAFILSAEEAKRINGEVIPLDAVAGIPQGYATVTREPIGIVAAITPFNFPLNLVAHKVGPALAANNPIIVKPAESTPLTALKMRDLLYDVGLPREMLEVVIGDPEEIADLLIEDSRIKKISFTGSVKVGKELCRKAGMKSICMELGGNDPMIILEDADIDVALVAGIDGAFGHNGQRCTAVKRFIVEDSIADEFIHKFVAETIKLKVGDQLDPNIDIGPLINENAAVVLEKRVADAVAAGAKILCGGRREGAILWPAVLDHVDMTNPIVIEETFGPVAPFIRVSDFDEAIAVANDSCFGLQSGVFTNNLKLAKAAASKIQAGAVMINRAPGFRAEHLPFGGVKDSGIGREGIRYAVDSMSQTKTIVM